MAHRNRNRWQAPSSTGPLVLSAEEIKRIMYHASHLFQNLRQKSGTSIAKAPRKLVKKIYLSARLLLTCSHSFDLSSSIPSISHLPFHLFEARSSQASSSTAILLEWQLSASISTALTKKMAARHDSDLAVTSAGYPLARTELIGYCYIVAPSTLLMSAIWISSVTHSRVVLISTSSLELSSQRPTSI
jgi:hypothetical protein